MSDESVTCPVCGSKDEKWHGRNDGKRALSCRWCGNYTFEDSPLFEIQRLRADLAAARASALRVEALEKAIRCDLLTLKNFAGDTLTKPGHYLAVINRSLARLSTPATPPPVQLTEEPVPPDRYCAYCGGDRMHLEECSGVAAGYFRRLLGERR